MLVFWISSAVIFTCLVFIATLVLQTRQHPWLPGGSGKRHTLDCSTPFEVDAIGVWPSFAWLFRYPGLQSLLLLKWSSYVHIKTFGALRAMPGEA